MTPATKAMMPAVAALAAMAVTGALVAAGCSNGATATPKITVTARAGVAPLPPAQGAYFGAWVPPVLGPTYATRGDQGKGKRPSGKASSSPSVSAPATGSPASGEEEVEARNGRTALTGFERDLGRRLDIVQSYVDWKTEFPRKVDTALLEGDRTMLLTWSGTDTQEIVAGKHDALIRARARAIKATGKPIFLRWQRDMDKSSLRDIKIHSPAAYIAAWKHLRTIFKKEKVDNVAWVWCPTARGFGSRAAQPFYPGDDQVDWICVDAQPGGEYEYRDLIETLKIFMEWARGHSKPIMVAEFGVPQAYGTRRAEWLRKAAQTLQNPQIKAVVYFNSNEQAQEPRDRRRRYEVTGDRAAVSALREFATTPYFNPRNLPVTSGG
ncbi:glycoside hydrolase family 26 protein [Spirillospora sp. NPDC048911]|uniref:glycoside hydrolase family 26 protein n=1 Tax=Spirillospora sp. NPDC048911 TaxID=3364527 RepID=UPI00371F49F2